jgi:hypothetical protein
MRFSRIVVCGLGLWCTQVMATRTSYHNAHPVGWMHLLPVGESPGWTTDNWITLELNHANVWNMEYTMTDKRTRDVYTYKADFEQSSAILNIGHAFSESWAFGFEVPYANRNGGFLDDFIDQFHTLINTDRFLRHLNDPFDNSLVVRNSGRDTLATEHGEGVANVKAKLKWWFLKWRAPSPGACDCGMAVSGQAKFPTQRRQGGLTSGTNDYSVLAHLGVPLWQYAGAWATAGFTKVGRNDNLENWPKREWLQMYELTLDLGFGPSFGLILQARLESPLLMREHLEYNYTYSASDYQSEEKVASGWNSLVEWRGSESLGLRWNFKSGSSVNFMMIEDWGLGNKDNRGDWNYVNNAPDVAFISQWHIVF